MGSFQIVVMTADTRSYENVFDYADSLYHASPSEPFMTMAMTGGPRGEVLAGDVFSYRFDIMTTEVPTFTFIGAANRPIYDQLKDVNIFIVLPENIIVENEESVFEDKEEIEIDGKKYWKYRLHYDSLETGSARAQALEFNAYVGGNGKEPINKEYVLPEKYMWAECQLDIEDYDTGEKETYFVESQANPAESSFITVTKDDWYVKKEDTQANDWKKVTVGGKDLLQVQYRLKVGFANSDKTDTTNDPAAYLDAAGRTGFSSFKLEDVISVEGNKVTGFPAPKKIEVRFEGQEELLFEGADTKEFTID